MGAAAKKIRKAVVDGAEHTDASLAAMKTGEIAGLVAAVKGGKPPRPATKAKAMNPMARRLAEEMRSAGRPLSMAECVGIVSKFSKTRA